MTWQKGTRHQYVSGKWEGVMYDFRTCLDCIALRSWLDDQGACCIPFQGIEEELSYDDYEDGELVKSFRKRWETANQSAEVATAVRS